jgi:hypothetical protein
VNFRYESGVFASRFDVPTDRREAFQALARELVEWRLAEYLARTPSDEIEPGERIVCKVSRANGRPIPFLPDPAAHPAIPRGTVAITVEGEDDEARSAPRSTSRDCWSASSRRACRPEGH